MYADSKDNAIAKYYNKIRALGDNFKANSQIILFKLLMC